MWREDLQKECGTYESPPFCSSSTNNLQICSGGKFIPSLSSSYGKIGSKYMIHDKYIREAFNKKNGQSWEKVQTSLTPRPPLRLETLNCYFLLHIWALETMKWILRATYFFPLTKVV